MAGGRPSSVWQSNFDRLKAFVKFHGHCDVPYAGETRMLAKWAAGQRRRKTLSDDQKEQLRSIGYDLAGKDPNADDKWDAIFDRLRRFHDGEGHCVVPLDFDLDPSLGIWVSNQRKLNRKNKLSDRRKAKLNSINFVWAVKASAIRKKPLDMSTHDRKWHRMYQQLKDYKAQHGTCNVRFNDKKHKSLALWVTTQRRKKTWFHTQTIIRDDRKKLLNEIGFDWGNGVPRSSSPRQRRLHDEGAGEDADGGNNESVDAVAGGVSSMSTNAATAVDADVVNDSVEAGDHPRKRSAQDDGANRRPSMKRSKKKKKERKRPATSPTKSAAKAARSGTVTRADIYAGTPFEQGIALAIPTEMETSIEEGDI